MSLRCLFGGGGVCAQFLNNSKEMNANPEPGLLFSMLSFPFGLRKTPVLVKIISTVMFAELRHCEGVFFPGSLGAVFSRCCGGTEGLEGQWELALPCTFCLLGCRASQARPVLTDGSSSLSRLTVGPGLTQTIIPTSCPLSPASRNKWAGPFITGEWTSSQSEGSTPLLLPA